MAAQEEPPPACLDLLMAALQDPEVGVTSAAEAALRQLGRPQAGVQALLPQLLRREHPWGGALAALAACHDPLLRMRALTLLVALAAASPAAAAAVRRSGLLEPLLAELEDPGGRTSTRWVGGSGGVCMGGVCWGGGGCWLVRGRG